MTVAEKVPVRVDGRTLTLSNLDKVLYPKAGFTKAHVIDYYTRIAPVLLPHVGGRLLTLKRYPDGVDAEFFYEKQAPSHRPDWVQTTPIWSESNDRTVHYVVVDGLPTLVWLANLADLELHTSLALAKAPDRPTAVVFDLDPGAPADVLDCCAVALLLRDLFASFGLDCHVKTSGGKGIQAYLPVNRPTTYDETTPLAKAVALRLEREHPDLVVSRQKKELRRGKVLVDWSQNVDSKTTVCAYSLRGRERPTVSTPVTWEEVERAVETRDRDLLYFEAADVLDRVERSGDLFAPVLTREQRLPAAAELL